MDKKSSTIVTVSSGGEQIDDLLNGLVGAFVLVEVTAGITEASMTRRLSTPCTRRWSSTTAIACCPIMQLQLAW